MHQHTKTYNIQYKQNSTNANYMHIYSLHQIKHIKISNSMSHTRINLLLPSYQIKTKPYQNQTKYEQQSRHFIDTASTIQRQLKYWVPQGGVFSLTLFKYIHLRNTYSSQTRTMWTTSHRIQQDTARSDKGTYITSVHRLSKT